MGRMKEICIDVMNANNGEIPPNLTIKDINNMVKFKTYNWKEYEKKIKAKTSNGYNYKEEFFDKNLDKRAAKKEDLKF
tara:strand:- start:3 stop:236 length:234 start_codon:yes stop_codon:yes gene_type:complete